MWVHHASLVAVELEAVPCVRSELNLDKTKCNQSATFKRFPSSDESEREHTTRQPINYSPRMETRQEPKTTAALKNGMIEKFEPCGPGDEFGSTCASLLVPTLAN